MLIAALVLIYLSWRNTLTGWLWIDDASVATFKKFSYYSLSGMLGGTVYGVKYLYRVVAHGYWSVDRRLWRLLSPWLSFSLAFVVGAIIEAGWVPLTGVDTKPASAAKYVGIGFLIGYFSDSAVAKMQEIATVIFGSTHSDKDHRKSDHVS